MADTNGLTARELEMLIMAELADVARENGVSNVVVSHGETGQGSWVADAILTDGRMHSPRFAAALLPVWIRFRRRYHLID